MEIIFILTIRELKLMMRKRVLLWILLITPLAGVATVGIGIPSGLAIYFLMPASALLITAIVLATTEKQILMALSAHSSAKARLASWALALFIILVFQAAIYTLLLAIFWSNPIGFMKALTAIIISVAIGFTLYGMQTRI